MFKQTGFTLLEVMVATLVLAIALTAMVKLSGNTTRTLSYLEKKTYAQWLAHNHINGLKAMNVWPETGRETGNDTVLGLNLNWETIVSNTKLSHFRRIEMIVSQNQAQLYRLIAFVDKPDDA